MTSRSTARRMAGRALAAVAVGATVVFGYPVAQATSFVSPPTYTAGGIAANGMYYAKSGSTLTLTVSTDTAARCVEVTGLPTQVSGTSKSTWTFSVLTPSASTPDGVQSKTVTIGEGVNQNNTCTKKTSTDTTSAAYYLD